MPQIDFGQKTSFDRGDLFISLKNKNEKCYFRLIRGGYYDGKHFIKENGKLVVSYCPRIMNESNCVYCNKYKELSEKIKELKIKLKQTDKKEEKVGYQIEINDLEEQLRINKVKITFYYPILDREKQEAKILKTTLSVRLKFEQMYDNGVDLFNHDFILTRTEKPGADYYLLDRVEQNKTKPLTEKEKKEIAKAKLWNLEEIIVGRKSNLELDEQQTNNEELNENINPEDIPF